MKPADDFHDLGHGLFEWSAYDPAVKVDLHAHALAAGEQLFFIDPIPLRTAAMEEMLAAAGVGAGAVAPAAVLVTNGNHARAAGEFRRRFAVPVLAAAGAREALRADGLEIDVAEDFTLDAGEGAGDGGLGWALFSDAPLGGIALPGFAAGEMALIAGTGGGGTLIVGDALIHLPAPFGFAPLPAKYCQDPKLSRRSLRALWDGVMPFNRLAFAHGTPILSDARARLKALLAADADAR